MEHIEHENGGHFVSESTTTSNVKKVAHPVSRTKEADIRPLVVPAELVGFKYLSASEKIVLAF